jgi:hypothetical protein
VKDRGWWKLEEAHSYRSSLLTIPLHIAVERSGNMYICGLYMRSFMLSLGVPLCPCTLVWNHKATLSQHTTRFQGKRAKSARNNSRTTKLRTSEKTYLAMGFVNARPLDKIINLKTLKRAARSRAGGSALPCFQPSSSRINPSPSLRRSGTDHMMSCFLIPVPRRFSH